MTNDKKLSTAHEVDDVAYDSDKEPPKDEDISQVSSWRLKPSKSFSDWTIEISIKSANAVAMSETYHVHKERLAVGPRKSVYFCSLLEGGGRFAESKSNCSRVELEGIAAKAFPALLDFVYTGKLQITTDTATALHYLGGYFEVRRLRWEVKQFWKKDLTVRNCGIYYEHAKIFQDDKIKTAAINMCTINIKDLDTSSSLVSILDAEFWLDVLRHAEKSNTFSCQVL